MSDTHLIIKRVDEDAQLIMERVDEEIECSIRNMKKKLGWLSFFGFNSQEERLRLKDGALIGMKVLLEHITKNIEKTNRKQKRKHNG